MAVIHLGPHTFSGVDATNTLRTAPRLFEHLVAGLPPAAAEAVAGERAAVEAARAAAGRGELDPVAALEVFWAGWHAATAAVRDGGWLGTSASATVGQLFTGDGGVPKHPVEAVEVGWRGVVGDRQANRRHHGRPWQALCLWSNEVIDDFRAQGHPLAPGCAGENVTLTGLAWERARPGVRLRLGDVVAEISTYTTPCAKNARWFTGGDFNAMHERRGPVSRVYATVIEPGRIVVGDAVLLDTTG